MNWHFSLPAAYTDASEALRLEPTNADAIRLRKQISQVLYPLKFRVDQVQESLAAGDESPENRIDMLTRALALKVKKSELEILTGRVRINDKFRR